MTHSVYILLLLLKFVLPDIVWPVCEFDCRRSVTSTGRQNAPLDISISSLIRPPSTTCRSTYCASSKSPTQGSVIQLSSNLKALGVCIRNIFVPLSFLIGLSWFCIYFVDFCRAMLCISAAYAVMRCLSVCLSVSVCPSRSCIVSKRINISNFFHHRAATPF